MKYSLIALVLGVIVNSCGNNTMETESGLVVNFITRSGEPAQFAENDMVLLNVIFKDENGNEMYNTVSADQPLGLRYQEEQWKEGGLFYEAVLLCGKGDSMTFSIAAGDFFDKTFGTGVPDTIKAESLVDFWVGFVDVMNQEDFVAYRTERITGQQSEDIEKYLIENDLKAETTESGLRYIITEQGNGQQAKAGDNVVVHYRGTLLDGEQFDSSFDRDRPFEFPLGQGRVIKGWDEGIALLNIGSKATLIIPSALGYGERGAGGAIPPNAVLKFDVELLDIKE